MIALMFSYCITRLLIVLILMHQFIGQSTKKGKKTSSSSSGQDALAGMNQAQQQKVLKQFSEGVYNILVCTCVGEEGLDVSDGFCALKLALISLL